MQAGKLRHRIRIERATDVTDEDTGAPGLEWSLFKERWAAVEPISGREIMQADHVAGELSHRVRLRWTDGITPKMRVDFKGRKLDILAVINKEERDIELELLCLEQV